MMFAYTDVVRRRITGEQEPLIIAPINELDASNYWIEGFYDARTMFHFSENHLIIQNPSKIKMDLEEELDIDISLSGYCSKE